MNGAKEIVDSLLETDRKAELEAFIDALDKQVVVSGDEEHVFPNGRAAAICTSGACIVADHFGGKRFGFPGDYSIENRDTQGGHDFAVVDDRYIVDYWIKHVVGDARGVFDMRDPNDAKLIQHYYGDQTKWE